MTKPIAKFAVAGLVAMSAATLQAEARSDTGRRGISGGVEVSPVDRLGPTFEADNRLLPDTGWNSSDSAGAAAPNRTTLPSLVPPPTPPPRRGYIILKNGSGQ